MTPLLRERPIVLLVLLLTGVALYWSTLGQEFSDVGSAHSPVFFPQIVLALWIGLTALAIVQSVLKNEANEPIENALWLAVIVLGGVVYVNLISTFGFFLTSVGFCLVALPAFGIRHPLIVLVFALATPGAIVALFNHTLAMPLPTSPFTYWF